jgi:Fur family transcriptional regulator, ferric uptake regulator
VENENKVIFTKLKIKHTIQRDQILTFLKHQELPMTADEIFLALQNSAVSINLSTVYRVLDVFVSKGVVVRNMISEEHKAKYEINHQEHKHHLICYRCKKVEVIKGCPLEEYEKNLMAQTNYEIVSHKLEIMGCCPECREKLVDNPLEK